MTLFLKANMRTSLLAILCAITVTSRMTMGLSMSRRHKAPTTMTMQTDFSTSEPTKTSSSESIGPKSTRRSFLASSAGTGLASVAAAISLTTATTASPALADGLPSQGAKAPEFELPNSRGTGLTSLQSLTKTGKWTVLYFYPGAFTTGCTLEARSFQKDLENYRKLNTQIVGVSVDPVEKNAQFCTEEQLDFVLLSDKGGMVSKKYGSALSIPGFGTFSNRQTYIIDPKGELRWIFTDVESRIARHSSEVLDKLAELEGVAAV